MNLLEELLARAAAPQAPEAFPTDQPAAQKLSLIERLMGKKNPISMAASPFPPVAAGPTSAAIPPWASQAGIVAPGVGGLGNMNPTTSAAPVGPTDSNYGAPGDPAFLTPNERQMQALVDPAAANSARPPMPRARPREADGTIAPEPTTPTDASAQSRGPAAEEESASAPVKPPAPAGAAPAPAVAPAPAAAPQMAEPSLWDNVGTFGSKLMSGLSNNSNKLLAIGAGFAGAPNIGQGISRAAQYTIPAAAADIKNRTTLQSQTATYRAMIEAGVPPNQALAAVGNPDMAKRLMDAYIVDRKAEIKTVKDSLGNERLVAVNPYDLTSKDISGGGGGAAAEGMAAAAALPPAYDPGTRRDEAFLKALDPVTASAVKDIADGKVPATGRNLQKLMPLVTRYENGFDNTTYQARQNLQKSYFGGGEGAKALRSANTTIDHGIQLKQAIEDLHNFTILPQFLNTATGAVQKQFDPKYQQALKKFKTNAELYSKELDFALTGKSTVSGQNHIREMFDPNASPQENMASLTKTLEMLDQRVQEHENTYSTGMNKHGGEAPASMLSKRKELDALLAGETPGKPAGAVAPPPGRYVFDPVTKTMKPVQ